jgi:hypothetical protein
LTTTTNFGIQKMWKPFLIKCFVVLFTSAILVSCASVKGYERAYLNDEEMKLSKRECQELEAYFQIIREGASGADGGKTGGGCGCN